MVEGRFEILEIGTRYAVREIATGKFLRYSYQTPLYESQTRPRSLWGNFYSVKGFCQTLNAQMDRTK
jgi:hypothetical protein